MRNKQTKLSNEIMMYVRIAMTCDKRVTVTSPEPEPISSILSSSSFQLMAGIIVLRAISVFKNLFILVYLKN